MEKRIRFKIRFLPTIVDLESGYAIVNVNTILTAVPTTVTRIETPKLLITALVEKI